MTQRPDPLEIDEIVAHQGFLRALARSLVADGAGADDLVQETYLRVLERAPERPHRLQSWLRRVVLHLARDRRRAETRRAALENLQKPTPAADPTDALVQRMELHKRLVALVLALTEPYRTIVLLHHFEGLTVAKAAERLAIPLETARTRLRRALETLRTQLDRELGGRDATLAALMPLIGVPLVMTTSTKLSLALASALVLSGLVYWRIETMGGDAGAPASSARAAAPLAAPARADDSASAPTIAVEREPLPASSTAGANAGPDASEHGALRLLVRFKDGDRPAPNLRLRVTSSDGRSCFPDSRRAESDAHGELLLRDLEPGEFLIAAVGFASRQSAPLSGGCKARVRAGETAQATLEVDGYYVILGEVVDGAGHPVAGAEIWASDVDSPFCDGGTIAVSDAQGRFKIDPSPWEVRSYFAARAPGYAMSETVLPRVPLDGTRECSVRLVVAQKETRLRGIVVDHAGAPVRGALIVVDGDRQGSWISDDGAARSYPPPRSTRSGSDGSFEVDALVPGKLHVVACAAGCAPCSIEVESQAEKTSECRLVVGPGGRLVGTLTDDAGAKIAGATIESISWLGGPRTFELGERATRSDEEGRFSFDLLAAGPTSLIIDAGAKGWVRREVKIVDGDEQRVDIAIARPKAIRGVVVDEDGEPLEHCKVEPLPIESSEGRFPSAASTDAQGRFVIEGCSDPRYRLRVFGPDNPSFFAFEHGPVVPGGEEVRIVFEDVHRASACVVGRLLDAEGRAVIGAQLQIAQIGGNSLCSSPLRPEADGRFESISLPPAKYWINLNAPGFASVGFGERELHPDERLDLGELRLVRPAALVVRIDRSDPSPLQSRDFKVVSSADGRAVELKVVDRELHADGFAAGDYVVAVVGRGLAQQQRAIRCVAGETTTIDLRVDDGVDCVCVVVAPPERPITKAVEWTARDGSGRELRGSNTPSADGRRVDVPLCLVPGTWTVTARTADGATGEVTLNVVRGATLEPVELALRR